MNPSAEPTPRRAWWNPLSITLLVACLLLALGLAAIPFVRSPAQVAADAAAPSPTRQTVAVRIGEVTTSVSVNGTIGPSTQRVLRPTAAADGSLAVVTMLKAGVGQPLTSGDVAAAVGGRPLIVLEGSVPAYRTLTPGMSGDDVAQVQQALKAQGIAVTDTAGSYGPSTSAGVSTLYASRGYTPVSQGGEAVDTAQVGLTSAQRSRDDAQLALSRAKRTLAAVPATDPTGRVGAQDAVTDATRALSRADSDLDTARAALATARSRAGASVPLGEIQFIPGLPATVTEVSLAIGNTVGEGTISLASGPLVIHAELPGIVHASVSPDQPAQIITTTGSPVAGVVKAVSSSTAQSATGDVTWSAAVEPATPLADDQRGQDVRVTITTSRSDTGLIVPVSCVSTGSDGQTRVVKVSGSDLVGVAVTVGDTGDGEVRVTPVGGDLAEGDEVVVGGQAAATGPR